MTKIPGSPIHDFGEVDLGAVKLGQPAFHWGQEYRVYKDPEVRFPVPVDRLQRFQRRDETVSPGTWFKMFKGCRRQDSLDWHPR